MKDDSKREIDMPALTGFAGVNLPGFNNNAPKSLRDLAESDPEVRDYFNKVADDMKKDEKDDNDDNDEGGDVESAQPSASAPSASEDVEETANTRELPVETAAEPSTPEPQQSSFPSNLCCG